MPATLTSDRPEKPLTVHPTSALAAAILEGKAPENVQLAAARGAIPLDRPELLRVVIFLSGTAEGEILQAAAATLEAWPREELDEAAANPATHPEILVHLLAEVADHPEVLPALLANPSLPIGALEKAVPAFGTEQLDPLLLNQILIIQNPGLLDLVEENEAATPLQKARIAEIRRHFLRQEPAAAPEAPVEAPPPEEPAVEPAPPEPESPAPQAEAPEPQAIPAEGPAGAPEEPAEKEGAYERILRLNVTEKIALAFKGDKEERSLLIRDSNRSVQEAVIGSPKLTQREVEDIAKMRNVNDEILRRISRRREWMKSYAIVLGLVLNPKTPPGISMNLMSRLNAKDMKLLTVDKNVPDALRRLARKKLEERAKQRGG